MATSLGSQLAKIRAQSTNSLDLKAQKKAHSQSLLFDARVAATQDFDSIYQICYEGFEELCRLDSRFVEFASNVFSEQSKLEDRTQMTAAQNQQLDVVLEQFLGLVGSRLLLKPALKAVEWLVRRFRVHEYNTLSLTMTFLPYHASPVFPTILSILPQTIPKTLKFLHPYIQSLANPLRHAIVHTASNNRPFLTALSAYVLKSSREGRQHTILISFWASVATEAIAAMLDQSRSASRESQKQNQEDVVLFLLPILNEGLSPNHVHDLRVGCYMVLTVLASKADLDDNVISNMMDAVVLGWEQTSHAGLICLAVLAEQMQTIQLRNLVLKAIVALEGLEDDLLTLKKQYKIDNLVLGVALGIIGGISKAQDASGLRVFRFLMDSSLMDTSHTTIAIQCLLSKASMMIPEGVQNFDVQGSLAGLILRIADSQTIGTVVQNTIKDSKLDLGQLEMRLQKIIRADRSSPNRVIEGAIVEEPDGHNVTEDFDILISKIPTRTAYEISFLSHSDSYVYSSLAHTFVSIAMSPINADRFSNLPVLRKSLAMLEPLFLSFFIRIWCGNGSVNARAAAIQTVSHFFSTEAVTADVQMLLPYILYALADSSPQVRRAATNLVLVLASTYSKAASKETNDTNHQILGKEHIYGQGRKTKEISWLSIPEAAHFMSDLLVPALEECLLDGSHISQLISDSISGSKHSRASSSTHKQLKTSARLAIFSCLCSHVVGTPLYTVKSRLLEMLNQVPKVGTTSRTKLLLPLLSEVMKQDQKGYEATCAKEQLNLWQFLDRVIRIITPGDQEGIQSLRTIIESPLQTRFPALKTVALKYIQVIWSSTKTDLQCLLARTLLELASSKLEGDATESQDAQAAESLRALPLSTTILQSFIESLPTISSSLQDKPSASKRRRLSHSQATEDGILDPRHRASAIRRITLVLELVEDAKAERHPELLKGLFLVMSDLQHSQCHSGTTTGYLQILAMDSMLAILKTVEVSSGLQIDQSVVRADILIDCIRTTTSPQLRNTSLLLISALASVAPELILHSVMPVFTFMGTNILRQDDEFSAYVVKQTMESIIPCLLQSLHKRKGGPLIGVSELLLSFAAAFEHIPSQRRLDLFASLVNKVGPSEYLFALFAILLDKYPNNRRVLRFAGELAARYDVKTRLLMVEMYLEVMLDARKPNPTLSKSLLLIDGDHSIEDATANLLPFASAVLRDTGLVSRLSKKLDQENKNANLIRASHTKILENIFLLSEQCKDNKILDALCMEVLDTSLGILPIAELIKTFQSLLAQSEDSICRHVLWSFEHRLKHTKVDQKASQTACLAFILQLKSIIENSADAPLKHSAVACVDRIVESFGKKDVSAVIDSGHTVSGDKCLGATESSLRVISFLCLATMVEVAGEMLIPIISHAFPKAIENLATSIAEDTKDEDLHNAVYSFLGALLIHVPWIVIGANMDQLLELSYGSANAKMGKDCDQTRTKFLRLLSKQAEAKECFAALERTWTSVMTKGYLAVKEYLEILRRSVESQPKSVIVKYSEILGALVLKAFDVRRIQRSPHTEHSYDDIEIQDIENSVNDCTIAIVYKLNDATFRPLFSKILEWTVYPISKKDNKGRIYRQITWYTFLLKFFETLKSIVTSYAGLILENAAEILHNVSLQDEDFMYLWRRVILTLQRTFEHDQDDFYQSPAHFSPIFAALLGQLAHATQVPLLPEAIPAIAELAVATESSNHHKEINTKLLKYMHSSSAAVRLAAVQCQRRLIERLGEEWLASLSEMLPFIGEGLEDDDEKVEKEVGRWKIDIEGMLGESLNPMLQ